MDDGQGGAISTSGGGRNPKLRRLLIIQGVCSDLGFSCGEKAGRLSHASGAGTLSLPDLPLDRSLGRRRMRPHVFSQDAAGGEREQPSTVDSATQRLGQSGPVSGASASATAAAYPTRVPSAGDMRTSCS